MEKAAAKRKVKEGIVVSNKMQKTVVVRVIRTIPHPQYSKVIDRAKRYYVHTETPLEEGQKVRIQETRPLSKLKRWKVIETIQ